MKDIFAKNKISLTLVLIFRNSKNIKAVELSKKNQIDKECKNGKGDWKCKSNVSATKKPSKRKIYCKKCILSEK